MTSTADIRIPRDPAKRQTIYDDAGLTYAERAVIEKWVALQEKVHLPRSIRDLLTPEAQAELDRDLKEIADCRRRAFDASRNIVMP
jgi:hypothetical protein